MRRLCWLALLAVTQGCQGAPAVAQQALPIIDGEPAPEDDAVVVFHRTSPGKGKSGTCTAVVIAPNVLLTAAHCAKRVEHSTWHAYLGADYSEAKQHPELVVPITEVHAHPKFDFAPKGMLKGNDIGIAILATPLPCSIQPLPVLTTPLENEDVSEGVRLVGYGRDKRDAKELNLRRQATVKVHKVGPIMFEAGDDPFSSFESHNSCHGDSGGPVLVDHDGAPTVIGLTSYGRDDCGAPNLYTRVDKMVDFWKPFVDGAAECGDSDDAALQEP
jgi:V8-like Glu-specific endopeptidase